MSAAHERTFILNLKCGHRTRETNFVGAEPFTVWPESPFDDIGGTPVPRWCHEHPNHYFTEVESWEEVFDDPHGEGCTEPEGP